ncbi:hypothetical protein L1987_35442 [Smallanthus sonchifolius]|uniref:Uncharacterized protein n=1 Tax=Smallanthus sonchifolius TaxID=185202 RepID=A0ACB9HX48_9ASTR|nr:hypothetical protein L1987_35442 [Smallanthus sonchifolius]
MFSLQQSGELIYHEIPSSISLRNQQDLIVNLHDLVNMERNPNLAASKATKRQRDQSTPKLNPASTADEIEDRKNEHMHRKLVHRETEKKRREDLSKLYASLGGLLPPNFVKANDTTLTDLSMLQQRLTAIANNRPEFNYETKVINFACMSS